MNSLIRVRDVVGIIAKSHLAIIIARSHPTVVVTRSLPVAVVARSLPAVVAKSFQVIVAVSYLPSLHS